MATLVAMQLQPRDAVQAATHPDPYPWYQSLRETQPLACDASLKLWVAADACTVREALAHPQLRVRPPAEPVPAALVGSPAGEVFARLVRMNDGEFHARHRPEVSAQAQRMSLEAAAAAGQEAARALVGRCDPNELLSAVPVRAIALLLDIAPPQLQDTTQWVLHFVAGIAPGADAQAIAAANEAAVALMAQGEALGLDPVRAANRIAFMQQALDATAGLIGNSLLVLRRDGALAGNPLREVVAEVARWDAPVQNTRRFAAQDLELGGQSIREGQGVLLLLASANRDPALNAEPDRLWPGRPQRCSLGFGSGAHACPGEALAIAIAAAALPEIRDSVGAHTGYRPLPNARVPTFNIRKD
jgi:cytochrome P450